ncbi:undecaprenyldiphospho-muramoylpentapeptide beta-N- acetylglucosaminyltransferase [Candidatus Magnetoovum chiemensis]|nr:undecaprenyldiphospho-muramoylpentapeptide beta-N- acetylglucosaminyltransferase [Candidatus Magnetoovum chiemensis]
MKNRHRIVIAGGGSGGHLYPGLAVAQEFERVLKNADIYFIGSVNGIEAKVLPHEKKYFVKLLNTEGFVGKSLTKKIAALYRFILAFFDVYFFLRKLKPDLVIGTGGYASFIPVFTAFMIPIPTIILEQNTVPGLANRMLGKFAKKVCLTYENSMRCFSRRKAVLTGNPVRESILTTDRAKAFSAFYLDRDKFTVFIFGGSAGASSINKGAVDALEYLSDLKDNIQFIHQTGAKDLDYVKNAYKKLGFNGVVSAFILNIAEAYSISDIAVTRAGATTLAELTARGIPAILIPYPYAASSHQEINASRLSESSAAIMIKDSELNGQILSEKIRQLYTNKDMKENIRRNCLAFGRPDAARKVTALALQFIKSKKSYCKQEYRCLTNTG